METGGRDEILQKNNQILEVFSYYQFNLTGLRGFNREYLKTEYYCAGCLF